MHPSPEALPAVRVLRVLPAPEVLQLEDGSTVMLYEGSRGEPDFSPSERRVRLLLGGAHFSVASNVTRPFIAAIGSRATSALVSTELKPNHVFANPAERRRSSTELTAGSPNPPYFTVSVPFISM